MSGELPPLPPQRVINRHLPTGVALHGYAADDMRAYAVAAVAAERERWAIRCEALAAAEPRNHKWTAKTLRDLSDEMRA